MPSRDLEKWMWSEALRMLERAERVQRQALQPGAAANRRWEPAVDVYETGEHLWVVAALPGVAPDLIGIEIEQGVLILSGQRSLPKAAHEGLTHRLEIPYGRFERRLALPRRPLELVLHELADGCLYLGFRKL
ncbi:MAG: Hsp20/alpha crystallin family protein [Pseudomonadales bacterium]|nr:Hsp20/alpha crystallin family protein [Pseudomonadales bacterium]